MHQEVFDMCVSINEKSFRTLVAMGPWNMVIIVKNVN